MSDTLYIKVAPQDINFINRIMEGYEYIGVVTTVNKAEGILRVRVTPDTFNEAVTVLENLPVCFDFVE